MSNLKLDPQLLQLLELKYHSQIHGDFWFYALFWLPFISIPCLFMMYFSLQSYFAGEGNPFGYGIGIIAFFILAKTINSTINEYRKDKQQLEDQTLYKLISQKPDSIVWIYPSIIQLHNSEASRNMKQYSYSIIFCLDSGKLEVLNIETSNKASSFSNKVNQIVSYLETIIPEATLGWSSEAYYRFKDNPKLLKDGSLHCQDNSNKMIAYKTNFSNEDIALDTKQVLEKKFGKASWQYQAFLFFLEWRWLLIIAGFILFVLGAIIKNVYILTFAIILMIIYAVHWVRVTWLGKDF